MNGSTVVLIDRGEGAMGQPKRAGVEFRDVTDIFLTHHHFGHIGSLFACLGLNMMTLRAPPQTAPAYVVRISFRFTERVTIGQDLETL